MTPFPGRSSLSRARCCGRSDLALLTVPDDVLPGLVEGLVATEAPLEGRMLAHASGRHGLAVLEPAVRRGALPLALHPVMTFTGRADDTDRLAGTCFGVTAPDVLRPAAEALVIEMGGEPVFVPDEHRDLYHAALAGAANHLITLVTQAADLLRAAEVADPARLLEPLLYASLDNALRFGDAALTGPVARGDADTVAAHIAALSATPAASPAVIAAYTAMARLTADRALATGLLKAGDARAPARRAGRPVPLRPRPPGRLRGRPACEPAGRAACEPARPGRLRAQRPGPPCWPLRPASRLPARRWPPPSCWSRPWAPCTPGMPPCCARRAR